ncbi:hypothetical protein CDL15_Pgr026199 [Punica granatum]|uniref:Uncharacterized protein n=1 Tax=Punica granatum TaxID=22663 RepID=A0A218VR98_PUNGR|nr:hypothetical protein CDL15_Pgr026199 [Punica granatum]
MRAPTRRNLGTHSLATPLGTLRGFGLVPACFVCLFIYHFPQFFAYLLYALLFPAHALHIILASRYLWVASHDR